MRKKSPWGSWYEEKNEDGEHVCQDIPLCAVKEILDENVNMLLGLFQKIADDYSAEEK